MSKYSNADVTVAINLLEQCPGGGMGNMIIELLNELLQRRKKREYGLCTRICRRM